ncbi:SF1B family DNA helicase RecD2 [Pseudalkalibacillus caeni]|uniref:SF1B family DNA helicase RecD2 n=1 Tax=Exobacillus caeni TaxID=2574798 RepID=UPI0024824E12|nr:ATP-dependent RecD-like DNA helicase [Pseudalkalibacillus caeni]
MSETIEQKKFIKGKLIHMIYYNEDSMYGVARIRIKETNEITDEKEVVITGLFPMLHEDELYIFYGGFTEHPKYGRQYQVETFQRHVPKTRDGLVQYLSSDLFSGIGKKIAESIVDSLGENAINKVMKDPACLEGIPKLSEAKAKKLHESLLEHQGLEQVMIRLSEFGFGPQLSMKIYKTYQQETLDIIETNPYQMIHDIEGIGFRRADELGKSIGLEGKHPERIRAACLFCLQELSLQEGHVYLEYDVLINHVQELLNDRQIIDEADISRELIALYEEDKLILDRERIYLHSLYFAEKGLVTNIKRILAQTEYNDSFSVDAFYKALGDLEERLEIEYATSQKEAIQKALSSPLMVLTGGPGTGKTTVTKGIVELYAELNGVSLNVKDYSKENPFPIMLAAPTGRAAKRMSEATGLPAFTIHRLLGWKGEGGFEKDEDNPIKAKLLIVDEVSMVDVWLANQLFKSLPDHIQVVLVGDEDQLPSVGPGQVLKDLIDSNVIPLTQLVDIYRQAEGSAIIQLAHSIKAGETPENLTDPTSDTRFFPCSQAQIQKVVKQVCENALKKGYTQKDIQVLAPIYRGSAGIEQLNKDLQELFNPKNEQRRQLAHGEVIYRTGDKVLQLVNNPDENVFNGDIGEIVSIFYAKENTEKEDQLVVSFEGQEVVYYRQDFNQITHAYCTSIHKAQGSEFPIVVLPVVRGYYRMLRRNLIYTAITRSRDYLIMCGEKPAFHLAVEKKVDTNRNTMLKQKLQQELLETLPPYEGEENIAK